MKIKRIKVENFRGVTAFETTLEELGPNIVEGPNESGKSSLFEALDLLMEHYDDTQKASVKQVRPVGADVGTLVEAEIVAGPYHFVYRKQFFKGKRTELRIIAPHPENLAGRDAHDRVKQIMGEHVDLPLWKAVRMQQGIEVQQAELAGASSLARALDKAAGTASTGAEENALCDAARAECMKWYTEKDLSAKKELKSAAEAVAGLERQLADAEQRLRDLDTQVQRLADIERDERELNTALVGLTQTATERETALDKLNDERKRVNMLKAELETATAVAQKASAEHEARVSASEQVEQRAAHVADLTRQIDLAEPETRRVSEENTRLSGERTTLQKADQQARALVRLRRADLDTLLATQEITRLDERIANVEKEQGTLAHAESILKSHRVEEETLTALRAADVEARLARERLQTSGPVVKIDAHAALTFTVNGEARTLPQGEQSEVTVVDLVTLDLPQMATVTVSPGTSLSDLQDQRYAAERALADLLTSCGATSVDDAQRQLQARVNAANDKRSAQKTLKTLLGTQTLDTMRSSVANKRTEVAMHAEARPSLMNEAPEPAIDADDAMRIVREAEASATQVEHDLAEADRACSASAAALAELTTRRAELQGQLKTAVEALDTARRDLTRAREESPDAALSERAADAAEEQKRRALAYSEASAHLAEAHPEDLEIRVDLARTAVKNTKEKLTTLGAERLQLRGKLSVLGEEGLYDQVESTRTDLERTRRDLARQQRLAGAALLLHKTLERHRTLQRQNYVAPLRERIERLGRHVFGDTLRVTLTDDLAIDSRTVDGVTVPFVSLSTGAREQLCMITRVASAMLVSEEGGVPVVLDDTLGHTDAGRLESMGAVLTVAGRHCQVILITCAPERYRHLSQARVISLRSAASAESSPSRTYANPDAARP